MKNLRSISDFMKPERTSFSIFISRERILLAWVLVWILSPPNRVSSSESPILSNSISVSTWSCIALLCTRGDWFTLSLELWVCSLSPDNGTIVWQPPDSTDTDEDTLLGGDNIHTSTHASRIRSRLMKMLKEVRSGFIKSLIDLKFFMR